MREEKKEILNQIRGIRFSSLAIILAIANSSNWYIQVPSLLFLAFCLYFINKKAKELAILGEDTQKAD